MNWNYFETLIAVADDCPVTASAPPPEHVGGQSVARLQYEMLVESPYTYTQADVLFDVWLRRQALADMTPDLIARRRAEFFAKPQACLRSSPLPKRYGWGLLFDHEGRVKLCPKESAEYRRLVAGGDVTVVKAMRSKRA